jgi:hypothetical protein
MLTYADVCRYNYRHLLTRIAIVDFDVHNGIKAL